MFGLTGYKFDIIHTVVLICMYNATYVALYIVELLRTWGWSIQTETCSPIKGEKLVHPAQLLFIVYGWIKYATCIL